MCLQVADFAGWPGGLELTLARAASPPRYRLSLGGRDIFYSGRRSTTLAEGTNKREEKRKSATETERDREKGSEIAR